MLDSISPIDGRYRKYTEPLAEFFSEEAFMRYRIFMEERYLAELLKIIKKPSKRILELSKNFTSQDAKEIKKIEATTNHDFKAIEYWIKSKLPENIKEYVHFGLTSEDATNIAYALMIRDALTKILIPKLEQILKTLRKLRGETSQYPMLARTHGQPASPTTFGKEMAVFATRLERQMKQLIPFKFTAKLNGATGNYNALAVAFPKINWIAFSKKFISSLGLEPSLITTQINPYDNQVEFFDIMRRTNMILIGLDQDLWRYISDGWLKQKPVAEEVGSSTMPHKINPWFFENSEGNLGAANALFGFFANKLPISRLQRDLSDSTVERSIGTAFGHSLIGYEYLLKALERIDVDKIAMTQALDDHPEVITEAIQTILRREGVPMPYEKLKDLTRGKSPTIADLHAFVDSLDIDDRVKKEIHRITPSTYIGLADKIASHG